MLKPITFVSWNYGDADTGAESVESQGGDGAPVQHIAEGGFSWDDWDGSEGSLPEDQKAAYAAINKQRENSASEQVRSALVRSLNERYRAMDQQSQSQQRSRTTQPGEEKQYITRDEARAELERAQAEQARKARVQAFRSGMIDIVGKPQSFGEASVTFASQDEVESFESWMQEMFNGKMTPNDMLKIYRFDQILKAHGDAVVRKFEGKLGSRGRNVTAGNRQGKPEPKSKDTQPSSGGRGRVPSLEDFIKQENPEAAAAIARGEISVLENL